MFRKYIAIVVTGISELVVEFLTIMLTVHNKIVYASGSSEE